MRPADLTRLNGYIESQPPFPGLKLPSAGLNTSVKATATEFADLFKLLPVAMLAFPGIRAIFFKPVQGQ